jgi:hypothetical protein
MLRSHWAGHTREQVSKAEPSFVLTPGQSWQEQEAKRIFSEPLSLLHLIFILDRCGYLLVTEGQPSWKAGVTCPERQSHWVEELEIAKSDLILSSHLTQWSLSHTSLPEISFLFFSLSPVSIPHNSLLQPTFGSSSRVQVGGSSLHHLPASFSD